MGRKDRFAVRVLPLTVWMCFLMDSGGGVAVGRKSKKSFWTAFAFGVFPDVFAFGLPFSHLLFSILNGGA